MERETRGPASPSAEATLDLRTLVGIPTELEVELADAHAAILELAARMEDHLRGRLVDGELITRIVAASQALHRAAVALAPDGMEQPSTDSEPAQPTPR